MARNEDRDVPEDSFARGSFTFRRMSKGQVQAISVAAALVVLALILYTLF